eukprot:366232-Chlamydomonas_euryale.AAC.17
MTSQPRTGSRGWHTDRVARGSQLSVLRRNSPRTLPINTGRETQRTVCGSKRRVATSAAPLVGNRAIAIRIPA